MVCRQLTRTSMCRLGGGVMAEPKCREEPREELEYALKLMREAMQVLDGCEAPSDIGAHLDRALSRLSDVITKRASI